MSNFNLLEQYGVNEEDIPENVGRREVPDGVYGYTITDLSEYVNENQGSKSLYIDYDLGEDGSHREWFTVESDNEEYVTRGFSDLRKRLAFFEQTLADFRPDEIIGRTGTLELKTGRNGKRQYLSEFSVDGADEQDDTPMATAEEPKAPAKAAAKPTAKSRGTGTNPFGAKK